MVSSYTELKTAYQKAVKEGEKTSAAIILVEYLIEKRKETDPDTAWERLPWPLQYFPLFYRYKRDLKKISAVNPGMGGLGGLMGASKSEIYTHLSPDFLPETLYCEPDLSRQDLARMLRDTNFTFPEHPLICKPDKGERSANVKKVFSMKDLYAYLDRMTEPFLLQEVIDGPEEYAVTFRYNIQQDRMKVNHVVWRKIPRVVGDGTGTTAELLQKTDLSPNEKALITENLQQHVLEKVVPQGKVQPLSDVAALVFGTEIIPLDLQKYPAEVEKLENLINDHILQSKDGSPYAGLYYGRFDIRGESQKDILDGNFKILELNGVAAMPLHVCAPKIPIHERYQQIFDFYDDLLELADWNESQKNGEFVGLLNLGIFLREQIKRSSSQTSAVKDGLKEILAARRFLKS